MNKDSQPGSEQEKSQPSSEQHEQRSNEVQIILHQLSYCQESITAIQSGMARSVVALYVPLLAVVGYVLHSGGPVRQTTGPIEFSLWDALLAVPVLFVGYFGYLTYALVLQRGFEVYRVALEDELSAMYPSMKAPVNYQRLGVRHYYYSPMKSKRPFLAGIVVFVIFVGFVLPFIVATPCVSVVLQGKTILRQEWAQGLYLGVVGVLFLSSLILLWMVAAASPYDSYKRYLEALKGIPDTPAPPRKPSRIQRLFRKISSRGRRFVSCSAYWLQRRPHVVRDWARGLVRKRTHRTENEIEGDRETGESRISSASDEGRLED